ncbi:hypothetical protein BDY24DRAFT_416663 [Mrakia frigida]|uniref:uncharacterized protein n=1 Tax=Mrakia frigida TaxID=29902 RepID=UPI003FCC1BC9
MGSRKQGIGRRKDTCQAGATTPAGLYVCRAFVGIGQSVKPSLSTDLTYWCKKEELAKRVGLFISAGSLAGAFASMTNSKIQDREQPKGWEGGGEARSWN